MIKPVNIDSELSLIENRLILIHNHITCEQEAAILNNKELFSDYIEKFNFPLYRGLALTKKSIGKDISLNRQHCYSRSFEVADRFSVENEDFQSVGIVYALTHVMGLDLVNTFYQLIDELKDFIDNKVNNGQLDNNYLYAKWLLNPNDKEELVPLLEIMVEEEQEVVVFDGSVSITLPTDLEFIDYSQDEVFEGRLSLPVAS